MFGWLGKKKAGPPPLQPFTPSAVPDLPFGFGYKTSWIAVRGDTAQLAEALGLQNVVAANWDSGLFPARSSIGDLSARPVVFVTPQLSGWTMAVSLSLPALDEHATDEQLQGQAPLGERSGRFIAMMQSLAARFDDVQYFGSYRVVSYVAWCRARGGKIERAFGYADGQLFANFGGTTPEEAKLGFPDLSGLSLDETTDKLFESDDSTNEELPAKLAGEWSINPLTLEEAGYPLSVGVAGYLSDQYWAPVDLKK
jgi:hypothetical protein